MTCPVSPSGQGEDDDREPTNSPPVLASYLPITAVRKRPAAMATLALLCREAMEKGRAVVACQSDIGSKAGFPDAGLRHSLN